MGATVVDGSGGGWGEGLLSLWLVAKYSQRFLYVILHRSGTKKPSERSLTPHERSPKVFRKREEINRFGKCSNHSLTIGQQKMSRFLACF